MHRPMITVLRGYIETPLGLVNAGGLAEAPRARILIRPEGLRVGEAPGASARIVDARLLGRCSHLRLAVDGLPEPLRALVPGVFLPEEGTPVAVGLDPSQAFVFALD